MTNTEQPFFSIITVTLNDAENLKKTIESIRQQTFSGIELVVIDGKSTDHTLEVINKNYDLIKKWQSEKDDGIYNAMNKGIELCQGKYTLFLNSGDTFANKRSLETIKSQIKSNDIQIYYTNYYLRNQEIKQKISLFYLSRKMICHQTIFYHTEFLKKNKFDDTMRFAADYEHLIRNYRNIKHQKINIALVDYDPNGISSNPKNFGKIWGERALALKKADINLLIKIILITYASLAAFIRKK